MGLRSGGTGVEVATIRTYSYDVNQGWLFEFTPGPEDSVNFSRYVSSHTYPTEEEARQAAKDQLQWLGMTLEGEDLWVENLGRVV